MNLSDKKLEISMVALGAVVVLGLIHINKSSVAGVQTDKDVVYEMPRPKFNFISALFSLGDREVERKYVNPFEAKKKEAVAAAKPAAKAEAAKKATPPKQAQKRGPRKNISALPAQAKFDVTVVPKSASMGIGGANGAAAQHGAAAVAGYQNSKPQSPSAEVNPLGEENNHMTGAQWRSLILRDPSLTNVQALMRAFKSGEIDSSSYYAIVEELLRDSEREKTVLGIVLLKSDYTATSFTLAAQYLEVLSPEFHPELSEYLASFAIASRFNALAGALQAHDPVVVETALQVVMDGYAKASAGQAVSLDPRQARGDGKITSPEEFTGFIPIFQSLSSSEHQIISQQALVALSQMQISLAAL